MKNTHIRSHTHMHREREKKGGGEKEIHRRLNSLGFTVCFREPKGEGPENLVRMVVAATKGTNQHV